MGTLLDCADKSGPYDIVSVSDPYAMRREDVRQRSKGMALAPVDYHDVLGKKDIDAVFIAAPDHWHVRMAVDALAAGKDVYLEKPVTHHDRGRRNSAAGCAVEQADTPVRYATAQLDALSQCRRYDSQRRSGPRGAGKNVLVAKLPAERRCKAHRREESGLEALAWTCSGPAV